MGVESGTGIFRVILKNCTVAYKFKFILMKHHHERSIKRFQRLDKILYDSHHVNVNKFCLLCHRTNFFLSGLQPSGAALMSYAVKRFTVNDTYGKSNVLLDSTFKHLDLNPAPLNQINIFQSIFCRTKLNFSKKLS